uniref:Uncharacterized protein n=1 Tax=Bigelowiella natans TaxID=227086 RepID=A0A7S2KIC2_BIGNA|mmetsp:Transcript_1700/g.2549  ORF Transcript_1700/g.2549 Transcript_1700/m.2549 type:complete len:106 (+) Transcript_1700:445-762(+)
MSNGIVSVLFADTRPAPLLGPSTSPLRRGSEGGLLQCCWVMYSFQCCSPIVDCTVGKVDGLRGGMEMVLCIFGSAKNIWYTIDRCIFQTSHTHTHTHTMVYGNYH